MVINTIDKVPTMIYDKNNRTARILSQLPSVQSALIIVIVTHMDDV